MSKQITSIKQVKLSKYEKMTETVKMHKTLERASKIAKADGNYKNNRNCQKKTRLHCEKSKNQIAQTVKTANIFNY